MLQVTLIHNFYKSLYICIKYGNHRFTWLKHYLSCVSWQRDWTLFDRIYLIRYSICLYLTKKALLHLCLLYSICVFVYSYVPTPVFLFTLKYSHNFKLYMSKFNLFVHLNWNTRTAINLSLIRNINLQSEITQWYSVIYVHTWSTISSNGLVFYRLPFKLPLQRSLRVDGISLHVQQWDNWFQ